MRALEEGDAVVGGLSRIFTERKRWLWQVAVGVEKAAATVARVGVEAEWWPEATFFLNRCLEMGRSLP